TDKFNGLVRLDFIFIVLIYILRLVRRNTVKSFPVFVTVIFKPLVEFRVYRFITMNGFCGAFIVFIIGIQDFCIDNGFIILNSLINSFCDTVFNDFGTYRKVASFFIKSVILNIYYYKHTYTSCLKNLELYSIYTQFSRIKKQSIMTVYFPRCQLRFNSPIR